MKMHITWRELKNITDSAGAISPPLEKSGKFNEIPLQHIA